MELTTVSSDSQESNSGPYFLIRGRSVVSALHVLVCLKIEEHTRYRLYHEVEVSM